MKVWLSNFSPQFEISNKTFTNKTDINATIKLHKMNIKIALNKFLLRCHSNKYLLKYIPGAFRKTKLKKAKIDVAKQQFPTSSGFNNEVKSLIEARVIKI